MLVPLKAAHSTDVPPLHKQGLGLSRCKWPRTKLNLFSQLYKQGESGSKEGLGQGTEPPRAHTRLLHTERDPSPRWRPTRATRNLFWSWSQHGPKDKMFANHTTLLSRAAFWWLNLSAVKNFPLADRCLRPPGAGEAPLKQPHCEPEVNVLQNSQSLHCLHTNGTQTFRNSFFN